MAEGNAILRKWGNSIAVILPPDIVKSENIRVGDRVRITINEGYDLSRFFGMLKTKKTAQELKDESRKEGE
jgi:antitoxin component of MazEF toxin-antitoxin module